MPEIAEAKKLGHVAVGYEHPSRHPNQRCGACEHFIRANPPRCEHVKPPIRGEDWCRKFERDKRVKLTELG